MGSRSFFDQADEVVVPGGDLGEPEMSGRVSSGCAEVGGQPFLRLKLSQCLVCAVGLSAGVA